MTEPVQSEMEALVAKYGLREVVGALWAVTDRRGSAEWCAVHRLCNLALGIEVLAVPWDQAEALR